MSIEIVAGQEATIYFDVAKCIHSRSCVLSHPDVFAPNVVGACIHPDAQPLDELMHIVKSCPSGAIRATRNEANAIKPGEHHRSSCSLPSAALTLARLSYCPSIKPDDLFRIIGSFTPIL